MEAHCKTVYRAGASPPGYLLLQERKQAAPDMFISLCTYSTLNLPYPLESL